MVDPFAEVSFGSGDDELTLGQSKLELKKGDTVRISFAKWGLLSDETWDLSSDPKFISAKVNYIKGVGAIINQGPEYTKIAQKDPDQKIGTVVIVWPIDRNLNVDAEMIKSGKYDIFPWIFKSGKYQDLMRKNNIMPFKDHDLMITCKDSKYQEYDFTSCKDSVLRLIIEKKPEFYKEIIKKAKIVDSKLRGMIGTVMSVKDILEKLSEKGGASVGSSDVVAADAAKLFEDAM